MVFSASPQLDRLSSLSKLVSLLSLSHIDPWDIDVESTNIAFFKLKLLGVFSCLFGYIFQTLSLQIRCGEASLPDIGLIFIFLGDFKSGRVFYIGVWYLSQVESSNLGLALAVLVRGLVDGWKNSVVPQVIRFSNISIIEVWLPYLVYISILEFHLNDFYASIRFGWFWIVVCSSRDISVPILIWWAQSLIKLRLRMEINQEKLHYARNMDDFIQKLFLKSRLNSSIELDISQRLSEWAIDWEEVGFTESENFFLVFANLNDLLFLGRIQIEILYQQLPSLGVNPYILILNERVKPNLWVNWVLLFVHDLSVSQKWNNIELRVPCKVLNFLIIQKQ
jgi:hypothetical protein